MAKTFHCTLVTPEQKILDEEVTYASIPAWDGQIGIAPQRAPLMVMLGEGSLRLDFVEGGSRYFFLGGGFAQMKDNRLSLLTDEAVAAEEIVHGDAQSSFKEAAARVAVSEEDVEKKHHDTERARSLLHLYDRFANKL